jgi:hypothetical protein
MIKRMSWGVLLILICCATINSMAQQTFTPISTPTTSYTGATNILPIQVADFTSVSSLTDGQQTITFSIPMEARTVPTSWATWNSPPNTESSTPRILWTGGATSISLVLATPSTVVGFEAEPDPFSVHDITATFMSGSTVVGTVTRSVNGAAGALLAAASSSQPVTSVQISSDTDFAIAQVRVAACTANITSVTITTNKNCNPSINPKCSANIVLADGAESTDLTTTLQPAQAITLHLTTDFGTVNDVITDATGTGISSFVSGMMPFGQTSTTTASIGAVCAKQFPNLEKLFNYNGFDFHESQVTDTEFVDSAAMDVAAIQKFLDDQGSFLAKFVLVGQIGGFIDSNGNGMLDAGEPTYSPSGTPALPVHVHGISAATVIANAASGQGINPKILLATAEKENSLISKSTLPSTSVLNFAMGCATSSNFESQVQCAAKTLIHRFNDTQVFGRTISYPFFFRASDNVQHNVTGLGRTPVGFAVSTRATYAQYRYTPFIQSLGTGGGVFLFESVWKRFDF